MQIFPKIVGTTKFTIKTSTQHLELAKTETKATIYINMKLKVGMIEIAVAQILIPIIMTTELILEHVVILQMFGKHISTQTKCVAHVAEETKGISQASSSE